MRWPVVVSTFLIANLFVFSGIERLLDRHLVEGLVLVLLGTVALYAAVLIVMRIRARPPQTRR